MRHDVDQVDIGVDDGGRGLVSACYKNKTSWGNIRDFVKASVEYHEAAKGEGKLYCSVFNIGYTNHLSARFKQHQTGTIFGDHPGMALYYAVSVYLQNVEPVTQSDPLPMTLVAVTPLYDTTTFAAGVTDAECTEVGWKVAAKAITHLGIGFSWT